MSVLVQAIAKYSLSPRVAIEFAGMLANEVFGQSWVIATAEQEIEIDRNVDVEQTEPPCKKSKQGQDLSNVLPTRQTVTSWSRDGYMLNFKLVAEKVTAARDRGDVVVLGVDDSVKANGNKNMMSRLVTSPLLTRRGRGPLSQLDFHTTFLIQEVTRQRILSIHLP